MPIPTFRFDQPTLGLPRQPVPVRFACFATNWSIGRIATALSPEDAFNGQLLRAYEVNAETGYVGEVAPDFYEQFRRLDFPKPETLALIPPNHFVWSDELIQAYSDFVGLTWNREDAHAAAAGVRWAPALGDCAEVVAQSTDLSQLTPCHEKEAPSRNIIYCVNDIWTLEFMGAQVLLKNNVGIRYINYLLTHPSIEISAEKLVSIINPPPPLDYSFSSVNEAIDSGQREEEGTGFDGDHGGTYDPLYDDKAKQEIHEKLEALKEEKEGLLQAGKEEEAEKVENEYVSIIAHLVVATNAKGRPRSFNHDLEKMRKAVSKAIRKAIDLIEKRHSGLGNYLNETIKTGHDCRFVGEGWQSSPAVNIEKLQKM